MLGYPVAQNHNFSLQSTLETNICFAFFIQSTLTRGKIKVSFMTDRLYGIKPFLITNCSNVYKLYFLTISNVTRLDSDPLVVTS